MIGHNACGVHAVQDGRTSDNLETSDGLRTTVGATTEAELRAIIAAGGRRGEAQSL